MILTQFKQVDISHPPNLYYTVTVSTGTVINTTNTSITITGLSPFNNYTINITAVNIIGRGLPVMISVNSKL